MMMRVRTLSLDLITLRKSEVGSKKFVAICVGGHVQTMKRIECNGRKWADLKPARPLFSAVCRLLVWLADNHTALVGVHTAHDILGDVIPKNSKVHLLHNRFSRPDLARYKCVAWHRSRRTSRLVSIYSISAKAETDDEFFELHHWTWAQKGRLYTRLIWMKIWSSPVRDPSRAITSSEPSCSSTLSDCVTYIPSRQKIVITGEGKDIPLSRQTSWKILVIHPQWSTRPESSSVRLRVQTFTHSTYRVCLLEVEDAWKTHEMTL